MLLENNLVSSEMNEYCFSSYQAWFAQLSPNAIVSKVSSKMWIS